MGEPQKDGCDHLEVGYPGVATGVALVSQGLGLSGQLENSAFWPSSKSSGQSLV